MNSACFAVQDALYNALVADTVLQYWLGTPPRIYDHAPPEASFPFLTIGNAQVVAFDTGNHAGQSHRVTLHVWSRQRGRKEAKQLLDALHGRLHGGTLNISGQQLLLCRFLNAVVELDNDGLTYHGLAEYQLITQAL